MDALEKAFHTLLENAQDRQPLVALLARFFHRCETAHEINSDVSYADEAKFLHQQLEMPLFRQVWKMTLDIAIKQANVNG